MVGQPKLTLPCTVRAIKHDITRNTGEGVVDRTGPGIRVAVLPQGAPRWLFGVFLLLQMFILLWSSAHCFKCSSYHSTIIQQMCNIDVMFGRVRIMYIFGMEPLVDSDRKGSYLIRQVFLHLCVTRYL